MNKKQLIIVCAITILLSGCAVVRNSYVSNPAGIKGDYKFWSNGVVVFKLKDIELYLKPDNTFYSTTGILPTPLLAERRQEILEKYRKGSYLYYKNEEGITVSLLGDYFYLEILLRTKKQGFSFDPREVYLELENGKYLQASKYIKPQKVGMPWANNWYLMKKYDWCVENNENEQVVSKYINIPEKKWVGFAIRFENPTPNPRIGALVSELPIPLNLLKM